MEGGIQAVMSDKTKNTKPVAELSVEQVKEALIEEGKKKGDFNLCKNRCQISSIHFGFRSNG